MLPFNPFSSLTSKIYGAVAIAALVVAGAQTLRIEGKFCRDTAAGEYSRCLVTGFKQDVADRDIAIGKLIQAVEDERDAHRQSKTDYRSAQAEAGKLEEQRLAQVKAEQQEITDEVVQPYRLRLADARAHAEQLRSQLARAGEHSVGSTGGERMPAAGDAAGRADGAAADRGLPLDVARDRPRDQLERDLVATEQALQLDALIDWLERQAVIDVNALRDPSTPLRTGP